MSAPAGSPFPLTRGLLRILQQGLLVFLWLPWWGKIGVVLGLGILI